jgi:hypothetical protein
MKLVFGDNRRQKPIELLCPGGRIVVSRVFGGTVLVRFLADNGQIEIEAGSKDYAAGVRLLHETSEEP